MVYCCYCTPVPIEKLLINQVIDECAFLHGSFRGFFLFICLFVSSTYYLLALHYSIHHQVGGNVVIIVHWISHKLCYMYTINILNF